MFAAIRHNDLACLFRDGGGDKCGNANPLAADRNVDQLDADFPGPEIDQGFFVQLKTLMYAPFLNCHLPIPAHGSPLVSRVVRPETNDTKSQELNHTLI